MNARWFCKHCQRRGEIEIKNVLRGTELSERILLDHGPLLMGFPAMSITFGPDAIIRASVDSGNFQVTQDQLTVLVLHLQ